MKNATTFSKFALAVLFVSFVLTAPASRAQTPSPVEILLPEKLPVRFQSARLIKFEDKYLFSYRLSNEGRQPLVHLGLIISVCGPDGKVQMQHMWQKNDLQIVSDYEDTIALPMPVKEGARIALSAYNVAIAEGGWMVNFDSLSTALRKYQETGKAAIPEAVYSAVQ